VTLQDKVAIVTGASRGIGRGLASGLAAAGAKVVCAARTTAANPSELPGTIDETVRKTDVAHDPRETGDEPRRLDSPNRVGGAMGSLSSGHVG